MPSFRAGPNDELLIRRIKATLKHRTPISDHYRGYPETGRPTSTRKLDNEEKNTLRLTHGIPGNHRHYYPDSMGLIIHKEENYANK